MATYFILKLSLLLTLKTNCIKPSSYASSAYVVVIRPSSLSDSFVKFGQPARFFWANGLPPPPGKKFPVRLWSSNKEIFAFNLPISQQRTKQDYGFSLKCWIFCNELDTSSWTETFDVLAKLWWIDQIVSHFIAHIWKTLDLTTVPLFVLGSSTHAVYW